MKINIFENEEFGKLRVIKGKEKVGFIAADIAKSLGFSNTSDAIKRHCKNVIKLDIPADSHFIGVAKHDTYKQGASEAYNIIFEPDVYRLIFRSKLKNAVKFQDWVFEEVLPALREKGSYSIEASYPKNEIEWAERYLELAKKNHKLETENNEMKPKAEFYDKVVKSDNAIRVRDAAKILDTGEKKLFKLLRDNKVFMKNNTPYQRYINSGYFTVQESLFDKNGKTIQYCQSLVTGKGVAWLEKSLFSQVMIVR